MAIARVQSKAGNAAIQNITVTFDGAATANNLLVAAICGTSAAPTNPDFTSSGWAEATGDEWSSYAVRIFYKVAAGGETGITFASSGTSSYSTSMVIAEYSGCATSSPLDVFANDGSASGSSVTSRATGTTGTTAQADELAIVAVGHGNTVTNLTWSNSFTTYSSSAQAGSGVYLGDLVLSGTGTQTSTASWTTSRIAGGCIATFKAAAAATGKQHNLALMGVG